MSLLHGVVLICIHNLSFQCLSEDAWKNIYFLLFACYNLLKKNSWL